ncbi:hypothetical protein Y032_0118g708 [Ancylostoma ceylanicum]|uniref:Uncharacterized protein n=1 Tax=Ancylostoma ceylanicum TaxID=53326 RepID=A0A016TBH7_9BILA|nr:hypothetical protein Y032_0118g708 [Ancylostoma ceylanicum]
MYSLLLLSMLLSQEPYGIGRVGCAAILDEPTLISRYFYDVFKSAVQDSLQQPDSILFIGDSGLDPIVASSLFFGCSGLSAQWFILLYWVCPVVGWMLGAYINRRPLKSPKKLKRAAKKKSE